MTRAATLLLLLFQAGCSTRPRDFKPNIAVAPVNQDVQMRDFAVCKMMVDRGGRGKFANQAIALAPGTAAATVGAVAGTVAIANTFAAAATNLLVIAPVNSAVTALGGTAAPAAAAAGSTALTTALPIIGAAASIAIAASVKKSNEKKVKRALGACMKQYGHDVATWQPDRSKPSELPAVLPRDPAKLDE